MSQADRFQPASIRDSPQSPTRGPVALIYSARAGSARGGHPQALLERAGVPVALSLPVEALDIREPQGQRWRAAGCVAAVAAGGDGTVGAVATHAVGADLPLGILPLGTANDIARALDIPLAPAAAAAVIARGEPRAIDAGQAIPSRTQPHAATQEAAATQAALTSALAGASSEPPTLGAYFLHALTLGLNVEFARLATDATQRQLWGRLTYLASAIESLEHLRPVTVNLRFSGMAGAAEDDIFVVQSETALLSAINLPVFGGRLGLRVPGVRTDDRLLDFILIEAPEPRGARAAVEAALGGLTRAAQALWASQQAGQHPVQNPAGLAMPGARWFRARAVEIETEHPVELTLDGELRGRTPAVARVAPIPVRVIVPTGPQVARGR
ncbi:MAG: diacylglycerol/lipid kinase family protein [Ktedonobacterales bacterium]